MVVGKDSGSKLTVREEVFSLIANVNKPIGPPQLSLQK